MTAYPSFSNSIYECVHCIFVQIVHSQTYDLSYMLEKDIDDNVPDHIASDEMYGNMNCIFKMCLIFT